VYPECDDYVEISKWKDLWFFCCELLLRAHGD
jgi:hypothetical protein